MHTNGMPANQNRAAFPIDPIEFSRYPMHNPKYERVLDPQRLSQKRTRPQQSDTLRGLPASIEARTLPRTTDLPVDTCGRSALERDLGCAYVLPALVVLALEEFPEVVEWGICVRAELLYVPSTFLWAVQA